VKLRAADLDKLPLEGPRAPLAVLLYGEDTAQVVQRREALIDRWAGPGADEEMRLDRLTAARLRGDPAALDEALRARGFFPGTKVAVVSDATDGLTEVLDLALRDTVGAEARLLVTAGVLPARSKLRKAFESSGIAAAVPCFLGPLDAAEIDAALNAHGLKADAGAIAALVEQSGAMGRLALDQLLAKLALWKHPRHDPITVEDVTACAPLPEASDADAVMLALLGREPEKLTALLARTPGDVVALCIALGRQTRQLLEARALMEADGESADAALGRVVPPVPWARRRQLAGTLGHWRRIELEALLMTIQGIDRGLRGAGATAPGLALLERSLLRFAIRGAQRRRA
jgi:DNA polymerase-3 subunit delta